MKVIIAVAFYAYDTIRSLLQRVVGYRGTSPFIVLMYHSVKDAERDRFARQMDHVCRLAHPVYADFEPASIERRRCIAVTFDDGYQSVLANALPILRERGIPATVFVPTRHLGRSPGWIRDNRHRDAAERVLTASELRQMSDAGALVGSHGVTHRPLTELRLADVITELTASRRVLSEILGHDVRVFALPYGAGNVDVFRLATLAGYNRVFLNVPARSDTPTHVVGRVEVAPTDWKLEYHLKIRGAYRWLPLAMLAKRRVLNALGLVFALRARRGGAAGVAIQHARDSVANRI